MNEVNWIEPITQAFPELKVLYVPDGHECDAYEEVSLSRLPE